MERAWEYDVSLGLKCLPLVTCIMLENYLTCTSCFLTDKHVLRVVVKINYGIRDMKVFGP